MFFCARRAPKTPEPLVDAEGGGQEGGAADPKLFTPLPTNGLTPEGGYTYSPFGAQGVSNGQSPGAAAAPFGTSAPASMPTPVGGYTYAPHAAQGVSQSQNPAVPAEQRSTSAPTMSPFGQAPPSNVATLPQASPGVQPDGPASSIHQTPAPAAQRGAMGASPACSVERFQAAFDPLLEKAMSLHNEPAGKEGIQKGVRDLYQKLKDGQLQGPVLEKLVKCVAAFEAHDVQTARQVRDTIVRTTTTGWVEGGTWQWALKQLCDALEAAKQEGALGQQTTFKGPADTDLSPEVRKVIESLQLSLAEASKSMDAMRMGNLTRKVDNFNEALKSGFVKATTFGQVQAMIKAAEQKDTATAQRCCAEISKTDFEGSKTWLPGLKQLFTK